MSILQLDAGNTRAKWRLLSHDRVTQAEGLCDYRPEALLSALGRLAERLDRVELASVGGEEADRAVQDVLQQRLGVTVVSAQTQSSQLGLKNAYTRPSEMGVDRWLAMLAVWSSRRTGFAVVDAGSAVTVDYVDDRGVHRGGYILPGRRLMADSLTRGTRKVRFQLQADAGSAPGASTAECVNQGFNWLTESLCKKIHADCRHWQVSTIVLAGGDAQAWLDSGLGAEHEEHLVLNGLTVYMEDRARIAE